MKDTLKGVAHIGAELAAVKADLQREMERHRTTWRQLEQVTGLLREIEDEVLLDNSTVARIQIALSQQAEPVEPVPAQDEREAFEAHMRLGGYSNPEKHQDGSYVSSAMELWWQGWKARATRPAQTEQRPAAKVSLRMLESGRGVAKLEAWDLSMLKPGMNTLYAAPIAQTAPQPVAYADPQALANFEVARKNGHTSGPYCSEWMHAHQWRGEIPLFDAPQPIAAEGWRLVPVEPNEAIRDAIDLLCDDHAAFDDSDAFWHYLLAATPSPAKRGDA